MYLTLREIILVADARKVNPGDPVVYVRTTQRNLLSAAAGDKVFSLDNAPAADATAPVRYGRIYEDTSGNICIVPDMWDEDDAVIAREAIR